MLETSPGKLVDGGAEASGGEKQRPNRVERERQRQDDKGDPSQGNRPLAGHPLDDAVEQTIPGQGEVDQRDPLGQSQAHLGPSFAAPPTRRRPTRLKARRSAAIARPISTSLCHNIRSFRTMNLQNIMSDSRFNQGIGRPLKK